MNDGMPDRTIPEQVELNMASLSALLPQFLIVDARGYLLAAGPTAQKMLPGDSRHLQDAFVITRPARSGPIEELLQHLARGTERLELRLIDHQDIILRGHVVCMADGMFLLNTGFGMTLPDAVRKLKLNDGDFAASSEAMELLFLHDANREFMRELSTFNLRLNDARREAEIRAFTDPLTGLQNRRGLENALFLALANTRGSEEARISGGFAIAQLDLDHFKQVNDRYGHAAGDEVLRHVARALGKVTRDGDIAARTGGDEFVMILQGATDREPLRRLAERIISEIKRPVAWGQHSCKVSASIGICMSLHYDNPTAEQLLADADSALYASKTDGRGRVSFQAPLSKQ